MHLLTNKEALMLYVLPRQQVDYYGNMMHTYTLTNLS